MRPFLFLGIRAEDAAADDEFEAVVRSSGLPERQWRRVRLEAGPLGEVDLGELSGIVLGGGPFNASDPESGKSVAQRRTEQDLGRLLDRVVPADFPFLGACYGIGTLGGHQGAVVDRTYAEPVGPTEITLTAEGRRDPLFGGLPGTFTAFLGHKEAISSLPGHAVHLASSTGCPVQGFRVGRRVYATQFHPELDLAGLRTRVGVYREYGYFAPEEGEALLVAAARSRVVHPPALLAGFVRRFAATDSGERPAMTPSGG